MQNKPQNNQIHNDYGRVIPFARKDLYSKGKVDPETYFELSDEEKKSNVDKNAVWGKFDYQEMKDNGFTPFGAYVLNGLKRAIASKPVKIITKFSDIPEQDELMKNLFYVQLVNEIKNKCLNQDIVIRTREDFYRLAENILLRAEENNYEIDLVSFNRGWHIVPVQEVRDLMNRHFTDNNLLSEIDDTQLESIQSTVLGNLFYRRMSSVHNLVVKADKDASLYGWDKLLKDDLIIENELEQMNPDEMTYTDGVNAINNLLNTKVRVSKTSNTNIQIRNTIEQRHLADIIRSGPDYLMGENVDAPKLEETFGFNGIQYGEWVVGKNERQNILNLVYYSFADLAKSLNVSLKDISLHDANGEHLALAFGSQGKRGSYAFFRASSKYIHLNRINGAGSLGHEWFHAYDNYLYLNAIENGVISEALYNKMGSTKPYLTEAIAYFVENTMAFSGEEYKEQLELFQSYDNAMYEMVSDWMGQHHHKKRYNPNDALSIENAEIIKHISNVDNFVNFNTAGDNLIHPFDDFVPSVKKTFENISHLTELREADSWFKINIPVFKKELLKVVENSEIREIINNLSPTNTDEFFSNRDKILIEVGKSALKISDEIYQKDFLKNLRYETREQIDNYFDSYKHRINELLKDEDFNQLIDTRIKTLNDDVKKYDSNIDFLKFSDYTILNSSVIRKKIDEFNVKEKDNFIEHMKEFSEKQLSNLTSAHMSSRFSLNRSMIIHNLDILTKSYVKQLVAQKMIEQNMSFEIKFKNEYLVNALVLDRMQGNPAPYFSQPCEMFARLGEVYLDSKVNNSYLVRMYEGSLGASAYPTGDNRQKYIEAVDNSVKTHFKEDFDLNLENMPYIENQFDKKYQAELELDENGEPVKRGRGRPRKNKNKENEEVVEWAAPHSSTQQTFNL